ncbi:MAG TPA: hypothetical protein VNA25_11715, partial [Phycisphaerae bacterium]|nr:hypothetical protein [Phycisphaerae bacterium]
MADLISLKKSAGGVLLKNADGVLIKECFGECAYCKTGTTPRTLAVTFTDLTPIPACAKLRTGDEDWDDGYGSGALHG